MEAPLFRDERNPDELDESTQEIQRHYDERTKADRNIRDNIMAVYKDTWFDFYEFEPSACRIRIGELATPFPDWSPFDGDVPDQTLDLDDMDVDDESFLSINICDFDRGATVKTTTCVEKRVIKFLPYPKYEACTPSMRNIKTDDDPRILPFIQYCGEEGFDEKTYLKNIDRPALSWQDEWFEPDINLIALETVHRLEAKWSYSYEVIDSHRLLPLVFSKDKRGVIWKTKQRDMWHWKGPSAEQAPALRPNSVEFALLNQVNENIDVFCPSLNCIEVLCMTHKEPSAPLPEPSPQVTNISMKQADGQPCGTSCFHLDMNYEMDSDPDNIQMVQDILNIFPDESPCLLAALCKVPCYQIYMQRCQMFTNDPIIPSQGKAAPENFYDDSAKNDEFAPIDFCHHYGPCDKQSHCPCFEAEIHCRKGCRCDLACVLRSKGCKCKIQCYVETCTCIKGGRECDPEICTLLNKNRKRKDSSKHKCLNIQLQVAHYPQLEVKSGLHGLGTFAVRQIPKDFVIGEYIAELQPQLDMSQLHDHIGLNYAFTLNSEQALDAASVGNETRCFNHVPKRKENISPSVKWVNGEHRIAFYSSRKIKPGRELVFDYGEHYWQRRGKDSDVQTSEETSD